MEPMTLGEIIEAVDGQLLTEGWDLSTPITAVSTDSRKVSEGTLFIPLSGERFDGHAFIQSALEGGGIGCFTVRERDVYLPDKFYIKVSGTQKALRDLARHYKQKFHIPYIGITGSVGKTTTKDMVAAVLGGRYRVLKTEGNFNNEIGLPLTLLRLNHSHEICVLEMGMNHFGEIEYLSKLVEPQVAVITNIGDAHIENLGSREDILKAKCEIFSYMAPNPVAILNGDDPLLAPLTATLPIETITYGFGEGMDYGASNMTSDGERSLCCKVKTPDSEFMAEVPALGDHMVYPALIATAVAKKFGMTDEEITRGLLEFAPTKMRMDIVKRGSDITILNDTYNANPQSMRAALKVLADSKGNYKIAVLGDMFELGPLAQPLHEGVGDYLSRVGIDCLVAVGDLARHIYDAAAATALVPSLFHCKTKEEAQPVLAQVLTPGATVLVKASRGMEFEELVDYLKEITQENG